MRSRVGIAIAIVELLLAAFIVLRPWLPPLKYKPVPIDYRPVKPVLQPGEKANPENPKRIETINMILTRVNHLEGILSSSLFSLLISTTLAVGGGAYTIKDKRIPISGFVVFVGANFVYVLLSAQYYFMLTHFYSAMIFMIDQNQFAQIQDLKLLWIEFQSPMPAAGGSSVPQFLYLFQATLPPLLFASVTVFGLWAVFLRKDVAEDSAVWANKHKLELNTPDGAPLVLATVQESTTPTDAQKALPVGVVCAAIAMHVLVWATMIWSPFWDFFMALSGQVRL